MGSEVRGVKIAFYESHFEGNGKTQLNFFYLCHCNIVKPYNDSIACIIIYEKHCFYSVQLVYFFALDFWLSASGLFFKLN